MHHNKSKVLVVGTTADYIDWLRNASPGAALFLTDSSERKHATEPRPEIAEELLCNLSDTEQTMRALLNHLCKWQIFLNGILCFDCESMELTARIAKDFFLPYPTIEAIHNCRNKHITKKLWQQEGLACPQSRVVESPSAAVDFLKKVNGPCVLKPLTGSGSEFVYKCTGKKDCELSFKAIQNGLEGQQINRMYNHSETGILAEECINGKEYSCDFIIENDRINVIRLTRKILCPDAPFGTIRGYVLAGCFPDEIEPEYFASVLKKSATALGISRAICMLDFIVRDNKLVLLELAPRPGGDCLPFLLRQAKGLDILTMALDFAQQNPIQVYPDNNHEPYVGVRLHARHGGILRETNTQSLRKDQRVREIHLIRSQGHLIKMPPEEYDSWVLGHVIFKPFHDVDLQKQSEDIIKQIDIVIG